MLTTMDFETKSEVDIKKAGNWRYSEDPSTDVLCLKFKIPSHPMGLWTPVFEPLNLFAQDKSQFEPIPQPLLDAINDPEVLFEAHNAGFEQSIWKNVMVKRYGWPEIPISRWRCSAAKASALALPRDLASVGSALRLGTQKDKEGHRLMMKMSKPRKPTKHDKRKWHDNASDFIRLFEYCDTDVVTEEEASAKMPPLSKKEQKVWELDQLVNQRGIYCDVEMIHVALDFIDRYSEELLLELQEVTGGAIQTAGQLAKITAWLGERGVEMKSLNADTVKKALERDDISDECRRVLEIRKALSLTSPRKLKTMLTMVGEGQRIRGTLMYHGSHTGRWSGKGIQPQNLPRGTVKDVEACFALLEMKDYRIFKASYPDVLGAISSCVRGMLCAAPGKKLVCADFASIESRVLFWLSGEEGGLKLYREGGKAYEAMAAEIYQCSPEQIKKPSTQRTVGKHALLGCGFGMGWKKFIETVYEQGGGLKIDAKLSKTAVNAFREKFPRVVEYWKETERNAIKAVLRPGQVFGDDKIKWKMKGRWLFARLPSGRKIAYCEPKVEVKETPWGEPKDSLTYMAVNSKTRKWTRERTYGGKLVENITQAVARDLMVDAMLRTEDAGYETILTVHDELLAEVDEDFGSVKEFENLMAIVPEWGEGIPIGVEGWEGPRFKK